MFGSSLSPVVCRGTRALFTLFVCLRILLWFCFDFLGLVCTVLLVSLDCPFVLLPPSVFSGVYSMYTNFYLLVFVFCDNYVIRRGRDRMIAGFTIAYAISVYHQ